MSRAVELFREARQADDTTTVGGSGDQSKHPHGSAGSGHGGQFVKNNSGGSKPKAVAPKATPKAAAKPGAPQQHGVLPPPTTSRTMKLGQSGDDVRNLQYAMGLLGFQVPQDGTFDAHTQAAVAQAQQRLGIKPNGHASASLLRKMQDAVRLSPCVKESVVGSAVRLFQIARFTERFDPAQPRDDHGRWSLFADAIALLRKGGHDKAAAHLHEAQIVAARPKESRHASYRHDVIDAERIRTEADRLDEQHSARLFPGSRMEDPENRRLNRAQAAQRRAELAPLESRIAAHEHFFGSQPPEGDHVGTAQSHVDALQAVGSGDMRDPTRAKFIADRPAADARAADARKLATEQRAADAKGMSLEEWRASRAPSQAADRPATPGSERTDSERFGGVGKKALPPSKSASPRAQAVATDPALTDGEKRSRLKSMGMTPEQVDSLVPATKASPAASGGPLTERQSQVLRDLVARNGDRMAVEDARNDPELADLQERGLIRRYPLKGTIELTPAGRREMRPASPAAAKVSAKRQAELSFLDDALKRGESVPGFDERVMGRGSPREVLTGVRDEVASGKLTDAKAHELVSAVMGSFAIQNMGSSMGRSAGGMGRPESPLAEFTRQLGTEHSGLSVRSPAAAKMARGKAATAPFDVADVHSRLASAQSEEEARSYLEGLNLSAPELRQLASDLHAPVVKNTKAGSVYAIVKVHVSGRLTTATIGRAIDSPGPSHSPAVAKMARAKAAPAKKAAKLNPTQFTTLNDIHLMSERSGRAPAAHFPPNREASLRALEERGLIRRAGGDIELTDAGRSSLTTDRPADLGALASSIRRSTSEGEIQTALAGMSATDLRRLADELNLALPAAARSAPARRLYIAQATAGHARRTTGGV